MFKKIVIMCTLCSICSVNDQSQNCELLSLSLKRQKLSAFKLNEWPTVTRQLAWYWPWVRTTANSCSLQQECVRKKLFYAVIKTNTQLFSLKQHAVIAWEEHGLCAFIWLHRKSYIWRKVVSVEGNASAECQCIHLRNLETF